MGSGFTVSTTIERPREEVWATLADLSQAPRWMQGVEALEPVTPGPLGQGSRLRFKARGSGRESEVYAYEPPSRLALKSTQGGVTAVYEYTLEALDGATRVTLDARCTATGLWQLMQPMIALLMKSADGGQVARLKELVERS